MTLDDFTLRLPELVRERFLVWLAARDRRVGLEQFRCGYDHGYHDGQQQLEKR